jgi:hypothetical protein
MGLFYWDNIPLIPTPQTSLLNQSLGILMSYDQNIIEISYL